MITSTAMPEILPIPFGDIPNPKSFQCNCTNIRRLQRRKKAKTFHYSRVLPRQAYKTCVRHRVEWCNEKILLACKRLTPQEYTEFQLIDNDDWDTFRDVDLADSGGKYYAFRIPGDRRLVVTTGRLGGTEVPPHKRERFLWATIYRAVDFSSFRNPVSSSRGWGITRRKAPSQYENGEKVRDPRFLSFTTADDEQIARAIGVQYEVEHNTLKFWSDCPIKLFIAKRAMGYDKRWGPEEEISPEASLDWIHGWFEPIDGDGE